MIASQTRFATATVQDAPGTRTKTAVVASSRPVEVYSRQSRTIVLEALVLSGMTVGKSVPLLLDHNRSARNMVGSVSAFQTVGDTVEGTLSFGVGTRASDEAWLLVQQSHLTDVSIGYRVRDYRDIRAGNSETVDGRKYEGPIRLVLKWDFFEVSVTPVGADQAAKIRSRELVTTRSTGGHDMPSLTTTAASLAGHLRLVDYARAYTLGHGGGVSGSESDMLRSWASIGGFEDLDSKFETWLLGGYNAVTDSTSGWAGVIPLPNYLQTQLATNTTPAAPMRIGRGQQAPTTLLNLQFESWRLFKTGICFELSEEDFLDSADTLDSLSLAIREVGASFRRLILDSIWGCILSNPVLADSVALFASSRGNLGSATLTNTALDTAITAIASQVRAITEDVDIFAHDNLQPGYLIVPPELYVNALGILSGLSVGQSELVVRPESRLSPNAFLDPRDDTARSGTGTNWMVACSAVQAPSVILGLLNGRREPKFNSYDLSAGQWGRGFQADLTMGVSAVDGKPLYWGTGTA